ncbi:MAG: hypothetical protein JWP78_3708 [Mucilaginibacter sp.]|nr:hypothetical protein [Mucilaginibacter sp.]
MKKSLLLILILLPLFVKAQYYTQINTNTTPQYIYVGTLNFLSSDASNLQKIQVDIFGGGWGSTGLGITTYYIANRSSLVVNQVRMGSSNDNLFTLQAFTNSSNNNTDFYVVTNYWCALGIKSVMLGSSTTPVNQYIPITSSTSAPSGGIPLTLNIVPVMLTDASGNIGIGTFNPNGYKLAVKGNIHAQQVNVDLNTWPDDVFKKDYQLPTLQEVRTYIDQHRHLPEMPSEQEVIKDGLNVGEMNRLLTKKVEELTLYLIEKDKQIKDLTDSQQEERRFQNEKLKQLEDRLEHLETKKNN